MVDRELKEHSTRLGGKFKYGLSSPFYITNARKIAATFDGRKAGDPFSVHISANAPLAVTELLSFAMQLDYSGNKCNGNVVDFFVTPTNLLEHMDKYISLIKSAFKGGVYQLQMNVVDSKTLMNAKLHPEEFPNLVVRVWGFSAYFNDLTEEYQDLLIKRALEQEAIA
jgi:formate C-acetyltransferase